jgi:GntR family transcriptional regulator
MLRNPAASVSKAVTSTQLVTAPVYQQLHQLLQQLIQTGEFKSGERFLTERQIAERFQISRATANKALSNLVSSGVLEFKKGLGTFIRPAVLDVDLRLLVSFTARAEAQGKRPLTRVLEFKRVRTRELEAQTAEALAATKNEAFFSLLRLRMADESPVILERRIVRASLCPALNAKNASGSLYDFWERSLGLGIAGTEQTIRAVSPDAESARHLDIPTTSACLLVVGTGYLHSGERLWWERTLYRGDVYEFHNRAGSRQKTRISGGASLELVG